MVAPLLPELARDLSGGDEELVALIEAAIADPPDTLETVGFYGTSGFPPDMNCFLYLITQLGKRGHLISEEDKYSIQLLEVFDEMVGLPEAIKSWFPKRLGWDKDFAALGLDRKEHSRAQDRVRATYVRGVAELERRLEANGRPLRLLQFWIGDTLPFILVDSEVAARWDNVPVATDADDRPLGLALPDWERFFHHLSYSVGWDFDVDF